ncbi:hypothetical protein [Shewanella decolorationis]|uniref:Membrane protein n=1 Tax=Shewanella decolorationis S12 TaxID=1353536 RepID=A0ABN0PR74_9GAMM|nr:hypothetical protein [Shewanella decolorationis]ESE42580.1 membrane protein [Shewanella decolorationis S12]GLR32494.1 hypothetical protein GCM10007922_20530 [Shewanella decolorationis]
MNEFNTFFAQAYWWLSLFGGLHCLALAIYIRYFYPAGSNQKLLAAFLSLIGLYFLTGMLNRDNTPIPIHVLFNLITPIYFLLMPLLYLYCKRSLEQSTEPIGLSFHYWPALITLLLAIMDIIWRLNLHKNAIWFQAEFFNNPQSIDLSHWSLALPLLLFAQTASYFVALWHLLQRYKLGHLQLSDAPQDTLKLIRFRWLFGLTIAMLLNWLLRVFVVVLPFYLGDSLSTLSHALPRLSLLLSFYLLAAYGLKQITRSAYLRGHLSAPQPKTAPQSSEILTPEEFEFIQQLQQESTDNKEKSTDTPPKPQN